MIQEIKRRILDFKVRSIVQPLFEFKIWLIKLRINVTLCTFQEIKSALFYKDLGTAGGQRRRSVSFFKFSSIAAQLPFFPYHHIHSIRFHHHTTTY